MQEHGEYAHVHAEVYFHAWVNASIGASQHIDAHSAVVGDAREVRCVVVDELLQQRGVDVYAPQQFLLALYEVEAVCSRCVGMKDGVSEEVDRMVGVDEKFHCEVQAFVGIETVCEVSSLAGHEALQASLCLGVERSGNKDASA